MHRCNKIGAMCLAILISVGIRALHIFPNNDPIMGLTVPFAKKRWVAMLFPVLSVVAFDALMGKSGLWTVWTAAVYAIVGLWLWWWYSGHDKSWWVNVVGAIVGVLIFDVITGPIMSMLMWHLPVTVAISGQIPFTLWHLGSAVAYAVVAVPVYGKIYERFVDRFVQQEESTVRAPE